MTTRNRLRQLSFIFSICFWSLLSCEQEYEPIFSESPDERVRQSLNEYKALLMDAPNGWRAMLYTGTGAGYFYYLKFNDEGEVTMLSDFNEEAASSSMTASWALKALQKPTLTFDTYSYIHLPADPDGSINGGQDGEGLLSDFEFTFAEIRGDSVFMKGLKHNTEFILVRATFRESEGILKQEIFGILQATRQYTADNKGLRIVLPNATILPLAIDVSRKLFGVQYVSQDGSAIQTFISPFTFSIDGIELKNSLNISGYSIRALRWDEVRNVYTIQLDDEAALVNTAEPLIFTPVSPLHEEIGKEFKTAYVPANPAVNWLPGHSQEFVETYNLASEELFNTIYRLNLHELNLVFNRLERKVYFNVRVSQTSPEGVTSYDAQYLFDYSIDPTGALDLVPVAANEAGQLISFELRGFLDRLDRDRFSLHYIAGGFELIAGFYSQQNPDFTFGGYLRK